MTKDEQKRFNELCEISPAEITDEEWEEFISFRAKIKADYDTSALNFFENYFFEA